MKPQTTITLRQAKCLFTSVMLSLLFIVSSCSNHDEERRRQDLNEMDNYVKEHKNNIDKYVDRKWEEMESEFNEKKSKLEKDADKMNKEMKEKYNQTVAEWDSFKADYLTMQQQKINREKADKLKSSLILPDIEYDLSNVTPGNIAKVYEHFVATVKKNKDVYTAEEWTTVNDCWKDLNDKKDLYDNDITKGDNNKIFKLKLEYNGIKVMNKPFAEHS